MRDIPGMTIEDYHEHLFAEQSKSHELEAEVRQLRKDRGELARVLVAVVDDFDEADKTTMACARVWCGDE